MRRFLSAALILSLCSCGAVLHPERKGQCTTNARLDVGVVALDTICLCCFLIPGVICFAVDVSEGTLYLPPEPKPVVVETTKPGG